MSRIVIFRSAKEPEMFALTSDTTGDKLPVDLQPWRELAFGISHEDASFSLKASKALMKAIQEDGYCLVCNRSTFHRVGENLRLKALIL